MNNGKTCAKSLRPGRKKPPAFRGSQSGQALVPIVFVVMILTALAVSFATMAHREVRAASNFASQTERFYAARGALNYAAAVLAKTSNNGATYGVVTKAPDTDANGWMPIGDAWVKIEVTDTASRLDLNTADLATLQKLPIFRDHDDIAAAIIDWRTPGDQPSPNGAKSEYYQTLTPPYQAKSAPFDTVEELLLVKGMTPQILYSSVNGTTVDTSQTANGSGSTRTPLASQNRPARTRQSLLSSSSSSQGGPSSGTDNGGTSGGSPPTGANAGQDEDFSDTFNNSTLALSELLTAGSRERNVSADGTARININTATQQDLQDKLGMTAEQATQVVNYRNNGTQTGSNQPPANTTPNTPPSNDGNNNGPGLSHMQRPGSDRPGLHMPRKGGGLNPNTRAALPRSRQSTLGIPGQNTPPGNPGGGNGNIGLGSLGNSNGQNTGNTPGNTGNTPGGNAGNGNTGGANAGTSGQAFQSAADLLKVQGFTAETAAQFADRVAIDDKSYRENIVNINTAPAEVLATVPGMTHNLLNAILNYRQGGQAFQTIGDLFTLPDADAQTLETVGPHLATKSSLYLVRIKVRTKGQQGLYAVEALVEMTADGPKIWKWREVPRTPGWSTWSPPPDLPAPSSGQ